MIENALPDDPTPKPLKTTPLDAWHRALGARMVPFAGYAMPVQYQGVLAEHLHCRAKAALFDVSHMGQATLIGATAAAALERLVPGDLLGVPLCLFGRDPNVYPDPDAFKPSRFLDRKVQTSSIETAAFGGGPHFCLGYHFAQLETVQFTVAFAREMHARGVRPRLADGVKLVRRYRPFAQPLKGSRIVLEPMGTRRGYETGGVSKDIAPSAPLRKS